LTIALLLPGSSSVPTIAMLSLGRQPSQRGSCN
jgi:hypothetical protein